MAREITPEEDAARKRIGAFIRARRLQLELSYEAVAIRVGIDPDRMQRYETGNASIPSEILPRIAHAVKISPATILKEAA